MPRRIELFKKGEDLSASKMNIIVEELRRLQNIKGDVESDIQVTHTKVGVLISRETSILQVDDKYLLDSSINKSSRIERRCDLKRADIADVWRIRQKPGGIERPEGESKYLPAYRVMWLINDEPNGEGGWVTTAAQEGFGYTQQNNSHRPSPPKFIAQIGDIVILTEDDVGSFNEDGDGFTYCNIRDDAHFHRSPSKDGRIYFTDTPPGNEPTGFPIKGEMIGDPALANADTRLLRESVEWRPQLVIPNLDIEGEIYSPVDSSNYSFPSVVRIPGSSINAYDFGYQGKNEGWSSHYQPHHQLEQYGLGFLIKCSAENTQGSPQDTYWGLDWKVVDQTGDLSTAGTTSSDFILSFPTGSTALQLRHFYIPFVLSTQYIDKSLIVVPNFSREATNVLDTLNNEVYVIEVKMIFMIVTPPP